MNLRTPRGICTQDIFCASTNGKTYIHLVEDTDNDGDLWSIMDCDADDNDPLVH